jgi:PBP1b-binding outer membrane lipoprotein LpoB
MKAIMKVAFAAMAIALIMSGCSGLVGPGQAAEDRAAVGSDAVSKLVPLGQTRVT